MRDTAEAIPTPSFEVSESLLGTIELVGRVESPLPPTPEGVL
jgi:hypothetical protein